MTKTMTKRKRRTASKPGGWYPNAKVGGQKDTQDDYPELVEEHQQTIDELTDYYGGLPLKIKLFGGLDLDKDKRANDTEFQRIPVLLKELRSKTLAPYHILSRAGHRFVAPADEVKHKAALETAIRRINTGKLVIPKSIQKEINQKSPSLRKNPKYYLNMLFNVIWDTVIEQKMPLILPHDKQSRSYNKGRFQYLKDANINGLENDPLRQIKELQYLLYLETHRRQNPKSTIPPNPDTELQEQVEEILNQLGDDSEDLVYRSNEVLPDLLELLKIIQDNNNKNKNNLPNNMGGGKKKFGATYLDLFDPTKKMSSMDKASIEKQVQATLNKLGDDIRDSGNSKGKNLYESEIKAPGDSAGAGQFILKRWNESKFSKAESNLYNKQYSNVISKALQRTQIHLSERKGLRERSGNRIWTTSDPPKELRILQTIQRSGIVIPNVTTLMATYTEGKTQEKFGSSANIVILIDLSLSMSRVLPLAIEAALSASLVAQKDGGMVSCIAFESIGHEILHPSRNVALLQKRISQLYSTGGTTISAALDCLLQHLTIMGKANILLITDADIHDWTSPKAKGYFDLIHPRTESFQVYQVLSHQSGNATELMKTLQGNFRQAKFFLVDPTKHKSFSDDVLKTIYP